MEMYFCPLYSGSSGNALFCQYGNTRLLIDAGKTGSCLSEALGIGFPQSADGLSSIKDIYNYSEDRKKD